MSDWSDDLWEPVVLITIWQGKRETSFGTGFIVSADADGARVVTCRHVIDHHPDSEQILVNGCVAEPVGSLNPGIDLAVLHVPGLAGACTAPLAVASRFGARVWVPGWHQVVKETKRRDSLRATLGQRQAFSVTGDAIQSTFDLRVDGFADPESFQEAPREMRLHSGYSGSPVICASRRAVIAVASVSHGDGRLASAVAIEHLAHVWPEDVPPASWIDPTEQILLDPLSSASTGPHQGLIGPGQVRSLPRCFPVAFSFAGEQRALVRSIARAVEERIGKGKVFLDEWYEHYLAGADADVKL